MESLTFCWHGLLEKTFITFCDKQTMYSLMQILLIVYLVI